MTDAAFLYSTAAVGMSLASLAGLVIAPWELLLLLLVGRPMLASGLVLATLGREAEPPS